MIGDTQSLCLVMLKSFRERAALLFTCTHPNFFKTHAHISKTNLCFSEHTYSIYLLAGETNIYALSKQGPVVSEYVFLAGYIRFCSMCFCSCNVGSDQAFSFSVFLVHSWQIQFFTCWYLSSSLSNCRLNVISFFHMEWETRTLARLFFSCFSSCFYKFCMDLSCRTWFLTKHCLYSSAFFEMYIYCTNLMSRKNITLLVLLLVSGTILEKLST